MKAALRHLIEPGTLIELLCLAVIIVCGGLIVIGLGGGRPSDRIAREQPAHYEFEARR